MYEVKAVGHPGGSLRHHAWTFNFDTQVEAEAKVAQLVNMGMEVTISEAVA